MAISLANVPRVVFEEVGKSDVNKVYKVGPRTLPCGTPAFIGLGQTFRFPLLFGTDGNLDRI
jgi:hypothetical protein